MNRFQYRNVDAFLRASRTISKIVNPYDQLFRRRNSKVILLLLVASAAPIPGMMNIKLQNEPHATLLFLQNTEMVLVSLTGFACYLWTTVKCKRFGKIHKRILYTHKLFQALLRRDPVYSTKWMIRYDILVFVLMLINSASQIANPNLLPKHNAKSSLLRSIMSTLSYSIPVIIVHCLGSFFRSCLYALTVQLNHLNQLLTTSEASKTDFLEKLAFTHCLAGNQFKLLNSAHTMPVMLLSFCTFFVIVYNMYDMLTFNLEGTMSSTLSDNIGGVAWIGFWASQLVVFVILIERVVDQHEEFGDRLHYIIIQDPIGNLGKSKRLMAHLTVRQKLEYSASGFFTVNYQLISSIASSATTYLVILIQFAQITVGSKLQGVHENNKSVNNSTEKLFNDSMMFL